MRELGMELSVGDSVHLHNHILTVIDIHGDEITFRLDPAESQDSPVAGLDEEWASLPPR